MLLLVNQIVKDWGNQGERPRGQVQSVHSGHASNRFASATARQRLRARGPTRPINGRGFAVRGYSSLGPVNPCSIPDPWSIRPCLYFIDVYVFDT